MPLVIMTGGPCVGKTRVAQALASVLRDRGWKAEVLSEDSLRLPRATVYSGAGAEKQARAALLSQVERRLTAARVVILDAMNYVKGYRYQLWCACKDGVGPSCVVHVAGSEAAALEANESRPDGPERYPHGAISALWRRLEVPSELDRWETPLFRVGSAGDVAGDPGRGDREEPSRAASAVGDGAFVRSGAAGSSGGAAGVGAVAAFAPASAGSFQAASAGSFQAASAGSFQAASAGSFQAASASAPTPATGTGPAGVDGLAALTDTGGAGAGATATTPAEPSGATIPGRHAGAGDVPTDWEGQVSAVAERVVLVLSGRERAPSAARGGGPTVEDLGAAEGADELCPEAVASTVAACLPRATPGERVPVPGTEACVVLSRVPTAGELARCLRLFRASRAGELTRDSGPSAAVAFTGYLNEALLG